MAKNYFVAGTDTGVGKTFIACALLKAAEAKGLRTAAIKPVAAGCEILAGQLKNEDALALQQVMSCELDYEVINPVALEPPIAPHIAAEKAGKSLSVSRLSGFCRGTLMRAGQFNLVEGAGGWRVPLNNRETLADLARDLRLPVILVVGMRLGCINHAFLTLEAIERDGLTVAGWVANVLDPEMPELEANIDTIGRRLHQYPFLGRVERAKTSDVATMAAQAAVQLNIDLLL